MSSSITRVNPTATSPSSSPQQLTTTTTKKSLPSSSPTTTTKSFNDTTILHAAAADEYPPNPTLKYFLAKTCIAILSVIIFWAVWMCQPNKCEGKCFINATTTPPPPPPSCNELDPNIVFYQKFVNTGEETIIQDILQTSRPRKGFLSKTLRSVVQTDARYLMLSAAMSSNEPAVRTFTVESKQQLESYLIQHVFNPLMNMGIFEKFQSNHTFVDGFLIPPRNFFTSNSSSTSLFLVQLQQQQQQQPNQQQSMILFSMLLHPFQRLRNMYEWLRNEHIHSDLILKPFIEQFGNLSFESCLENLDCIHKNQLFRWGSLYTRTFCGFQLYQDCNETISSEMDDHSSKMLTAAMHYIEQNVFFIGIMEDIVGSFQYLSKRLPTYFEFLTPHRSSSSSSSEEEVVQPNTCLNNSTTCSLSPTATSMLSKICSTDLKLYEMMKSRYIQQLSACNIPTSITSSSSSTGSSSSLLSGWFW
jgi:hypothetical protein